MLTLFFFVSLGDDLAVLGVVNLDSTIAYLERLLSPHCLIGPTTTSETICRRVGRESDLPPLD